MNSIKIENLYGHLDNILSPHFTGVMVECCAICLKSQNHSSPVIFSAFEHKKNLIREAFSLEWTTKISSEMRASYRDDNRTTDNGAMCIALLLASKITGFDGVEASQKGDGVDFWFTKGENLDFVARLEISGIRKENGTNTIKNRLKIKVPQTEQSDNSNVPAFVSIIEFSKPEAIYILK
jgi:hypothetical protein